jgi:AraC family transcriptional regulator
MSNGADAVSRARLLDLPTALVEDVRCQGTSRGRSPEGFSPEFQVCLPYRGVFVWHVGRDEVVGDPNQVLFVTGRESYRISGPLSDGYAELIITPDLGTLAELVHTAQPHLHANPLARRRSWRAEPRVQSFRARFLHWAHSGTVEDDLEAEEVVLALLRAALQEPVPRTGIVGPTTRQLVRRAKEFLEAELADRIALSDVGRAVGASPAYLTDVFRRVEGVPLHRYLTQLRLARALVELPHADNLSRLALEVGFSHHSHFSAAFRRAFGLTPSQFRDTARLGRPA